MKWMLWIALTLVACGKSSDDRSGSKAPGPAGPSASAGTSANAPAGAAATQPQNRCEIHVTGAETVDIIGTAPRGSQNPKVFAGSDYWMTEEQLRANLESMERFGGGKRSKEEIARKVDEAMKKDPRLWLLVITCSTDDGMLNLSASNSSKSSDIPFGPHTYVIAGDPKAGEFGSMFSLTKGKHTSYHLAAPGKLEITKFDATGLTGTFSFEAETGKSQRVTVQGSLDYGCVGTKCT